MYLKKEIFNIEEIKNEQVNFQNDFKGDFYGNSYVQVYFIRGGKQKIFKGCFLDKKKKENSIC